MNSAGVRLKCQSCGSAALVTSPGSGTLECCGAAMAQLVRPDFAASVDEKGEEQKLTGE